jgi:hypothetical protein
LRGSLKNLDDQSQKLRRKEKNERKKGLLGLKYMFIHDTPVKDEGAAERI